MWMLIFRYYASASMINSMLHFYNSSNPDEVRNCILQDKISAELLALNIMVHSNIEIQKIELYQNSDHAFSYVIITSLINFFARARH